VLTSVRGCTHNLEAGGSRKLCELSVMAQVGNGLLRNQIAMVILGLVIVLVIGGVILPVIWSSKRRASDSCPRRARQHRAVEALTSAGRRPCRAGWTRAVHPHLSLPSPGTA